MAEQLVKRGIEAVSVRQLEKLGDEDTNHLHRATEMGYVLCTHDTDFLSMAQETTNHSGIVFAQHFDATIGGWVKGLRDLHSRINDEDIKGQVFFLSLR